MNFTDSFLVVGFAMSLGKRNYVSDISEASRKKNHKIEPEAKPRVLDCSMLAKILVPFVLIS